MARERRDHEESRRLWRAQMCAAHAFAAAGRRPAMWDALELAHILSQAMAWRHLWTHLAMLRAAVGGREWREALGQIPRVLLALPASWTRCYPSGNTGRANVSMFTPMPLPTTLTAKAAIRAADEEGA